MALVLVAGVCLLAEPWRPAGAVPPEELGLLLLLGLYALSGGAGRRISGRLARRLVFFAAVLTLSTAAAILAEVGWPGRVFLEQGLLRAQGVLPLDQLEIYQVLRAALLLLEGLGVLWMGAGTLCASGARKAAAGLVLVVAAAAVLEALRQRVTGEGLPQHWEDLEPLLRRVGSFYGDPNVLGSVLCLLLPAVLAESRGRGRLARTALLGLSAGAVLCVVLTWSRAALGALLLWGAASAYAAGWAGRWLRAAKRRSGWVAAGAGLLALTAAGAVVLAEGSALRFWLEKSFGQERLDDALGGRLEVWETGARMVLDFPLLGSGPGSCYRRYALYVRNRGAVAEGVHADPSLEGRNLHNTFLQMAAETGLLGLGGFAAVLGAVLGIGMQSRSRRSRGATAGVMLFLLTCMTGHPLLDRGAALLFWLLCAMAIAEGERPEVPSGRRRWNVCGWGLLGLAGAAHLGAALAVGRESVYELGLYGAPTAGRRVEELKLSGPAADPGWWWMGRRAQLSLVVRGPTLRMPILLRHPDLERRPVDVAVRVAGALRVEKRFQEQGSAQLVVPLLPSETSRLLVKLDLEVSRTFVPADLGISDDTRPLGLALSASSFDVTDAGRGWHAAEPGGRWTRLWVEGAARRAGPGQLRFEAAHPELEREPLQVVLYSGERLLEAQAIHRPGEVRLHLDGAVRAGDGIRLELSRTWVPVRYGVSADSRELGARFASEELEAGLVDFGLGPAQGE